MRSVLQFIKCFSYIYIYLIWSSMLLFEYLIIEILEVARAYLNYVNFVPSCCTYWFEYVNKIFRLITILPIKIITRCKFHKMCSLSGINPPASEWKMGSRIAWDHSGKLNQRKVIRKNFIWVAKQLTGKNSSQVNWSTKFVRCMTFVSDSSLIVRPLLHHN